MQQHTSDDLLTTNGAARLLAVADVTVRALEGRGILPAIRTENGLRLFRRGDVERLRLERRARGAASRETKDLSVGPFVGGQLALERRG